LAVAGLVGLLIAFALGVLLAFAQAQNRVVRQRSLDAAMKSIRFDRFDQRDPFAPPPPPPRQEPEPWSRQGLQGLVIGLLGAVLLARLLYALSLWQVACHLGRRGLAGSLLVYVVITGLIDLAGLIFLSIAAFSPETLPNVSLTPLDPQRQAAVEWLVVGVFTLLGSWLVIHVFLVRRAISLALLGRAIC
jgi:hypothetical protein